MITQSILVSIQEAVCAIQWKNNRQKDKALLLCRVMFNQFIIDKERFSAYKTFSSKYFQDIFPSKRDLVIKDKLIAEFIIESDNKYSIIKGVAKGYRFNPKFFTTSSNYNTVTAFTYSTNLNLSTTSTISYLFPHFVPTPPSISESVFLSNYMITNMNSLNFEEDIDEYINQLATIQSSDLITNDAIIDEFVYLTLGKKKYRYTIEHAIDLANKTGTDIIQYNDKHYLDTIKNFITQKETQRKIAYCQIIFNLKHQLYYCNRNDTNNRLDYNLTGLKKELFEKIKFEGERLVELDIANAQFAIAAHINQHLDPTFTYHAQNGTLYQYIEKHLILQPGAGKKLMFRIAFDKVKTTEEFNQIRQLFPLYSNWADSYKKDNKNYKMFANLLQKKEAEIMIDGLLIHLASNGYKVFTIHDALRVKKSQAKEIQNEMNNYFKSIGFICHVRIR